MAPEGLRHRPGRAGSMASTALWTVCEKPSVARPPTVKAGGVYNKPTGASTRAEGGPAARGP